MPRVPSTSWAPSPTMAMVTTDFMDSPYYLSDPWTRLGKGYPEVHPATPCQAGRRERAHTTAGPIAPAYGDIPSRLPRHLPRGTPTATRGPFRGPYRGEPSPTAPNSPRSTTNDHGTVI